MVFVENKNENRLILPRSTTLSSSNYQLKILSEIDNVEFLYRYVNNFEDSDLVRTKGVNDILEGDFLAFKPASTSTGEYYWAYCNEEPNYPKHYGENPFLLSIGYDQDLFQVFNVKHFEGYIECELLTRNSYLYHVGNNLGLDNKVGFVHMEMLSTLQKKAWDTAIKGFAQGHHPVKISNKDVNVKWGTYDDYVTYPKGWDDNSVTICGYTDNYNTPWFWKNDGYDYWTNYSYCKGIEPQLHVNYSWQGHNIQWNAYKIKTDFISMNVSNNYSDYYLINLDLSSLKENHEYRYELQDLSSNDKNILESGLLMIKGQNDDSAKPQNYNIKHEYKQYNAG